MINPDTHPYLPHEATIVDRIQEAPDLFTLRLKFSEPEVQKNFQFQAGQFNMLYLYGIGEIPISIVSDPNSSDIIEHTIRVVGSVTRGLSCLTKGDRIGLRGPFGNGWPMLESKHKDIVVITGGLGCAPAVSVINYIEQRRDDFGRLNILQGVKHTSDFIWKDRYEKWKKLKDTQVLLTSDTGEVIWPWSIGPVTSLFDQLEFNPENVSVMICGPEGMMHVVCEHMLDNRVSPEQLFLSMERNMQCAIGHCGHCQYGSQFVCKDGPVFNYATIRHLFHTKGF